MTDDVVARRARIQRAARAAKRVGYLALLAAVIGFFIALFTGLTPWAVTLTITGLAVACVVLPVPIVIGYGVRAAEREDREGQDPASAS